MPVFAISVMKLIITLPMLRMSVNVLLVLFLNVLNARLYLHAAYVTSLLIILLIQRQLEQLMPVFSARFLFVVIVLILMYAARAINQQITS